MFLNKISGFFKKKKNDTVRKGSHLSQRPSNRRNGVVISTSRPLFHHRPSIHFSIGIGAFKWFMVSLEKLKWPGTAISLTRYWSLKWTHGRWLKQVINNNSSSVAARETCVQSEHCRPSKSSCMGASVMVYLTYPSVRETIWHNFFNNAGQSPNMAPAQMSNPPWMRLIPIGQSLMYPSMYLPIRAGSPISPKFSFQC